MRKLFFLFLALVATTNLWAEDFSVGGIYYNYLDGNNIEVTYRGDDYLRYDNEYAGEVIIPSTVTYNGTTYSITSIGDYAFWDCSSLTSITIPNSVTSIGEQAFNSCSSLTSFTIPNSVTSIGEWAFCMCTSLSSIVIPESVTSIGDGTFVYCSSFTSFTIPNSVTSIGDETFRDCTSLTSITIPNSVTSIGNYTFAYCSSLTSVFVEEGNTIYDSRDNCNAIIETATNTLIAGCQNTVIPNSVTSIGGQAFLGCSSLTSVTIPNSVTSIGDQAFWNCSSLTSITIPNSVTSIGEWAFSYCSSLTSITIPNSVTSIGWNAFKDCSSLTSITCLGTTPPDASDLAANTSTCKLIVPHSAYNAYLRHAYWGQFLNIVSGDWVGENRDMTIIFTNSEDNDSEIYSQSLTITIPAAPEIEGFTFLYWQPVAEPLTDTITIQAIYKSNASAAAPDIYINPANPAQKLLRNGQVYILKDDKTYTIMGAEIQ